jgi:hypothetical protein
VFKLTIFLREMFLSRSDEFFQMIACTATSLKKSCCRSFNPSLAPSAYLQDFQVPLISNSALSIP